MARRQPFSRRSVRQVVVLYSGSTSHLSRRIESVSRHGRLPIFILRLEPTSQTPMCIGCAHGRMQRPSHKIFEHSAQRGNTWVRHEQSLVYQPVSVIQSSRLEFPMRLICITFECTYSVGYAASWALMTRRETITNTNSR